MQGNASRYDNYLLSVAWQANAQKWERTVSILRRRVLDGKDMPSSKTFDEIVKCNHRYHAALAKSIAYASA